MRPLAVAGTTAALLFAASSNWCHAATIPADSSRGARILETNSCLQCHRINGKGGTGGSDLGWRIGRNCTPAALAATMWNHAPQMWAAMRAGDTPRPDLDEQAAADLFAYFYAVRFFEKSGDAERGKAAFDSKGCSSCHGLQQAKVAGVVPVSQWESASEPIALASAMWNHGAAMNAEFTKRRLKSPQLTSQDLTDLVIYIQGQSAVRGVSGRVEISSGSAGESLFRSKGCEGCHTGRLALSERLKGNTLTDITAAMWNHQSRMAAAAPPLSVPEMREIASFLWAGSFFEDSGDAGSGRTVFLAKRCDECHGASGISAGKRNERRVSAITMVSALWHHGPRMLDEMQAKGIGWPRFKVAEMSNLIAFLNAEGQ